VILNGVARDEGAVAHAARVEAGGKRRAIAGAEPARTVPCNEVIDRTSFPYLGSRNFRYRLVLDVVSAPPAYLGQIESTPGSYWRYWRKQGLVVRASGLPVTITVPRNWRTRAAIAWGYGGKGEPFSSVRIAGCGSNPEVGNAYSGGFYLRFRAACVPLVFRVGSRTRTVRFGLGRVCG